MNQEQIVMTYFQTEISSNQINYPKSVEQYNSVENVRSKKTKQTRIESLSKLDLLEIHEKEIISTYL